MLGSSQDSMKNYLEMFSQNLDVEEPDLDDSIYNDALDYDEEMTEERLLAQIRRTGLPLRIRPTRSDGNCWYSAVSDQVRSSSSYCSLIKSPKLISLSGCSPEYS